MTITKTKIAALGASLMLAGTLGITSVFANSTTEPEPTTHLTEHAQHTDLRAQLDAYKANIIDFINGKDTDELIDVITDTLTEENISQLTHLLADAQSHLTASAGTDLSAVLSNLRENRNSLLDHALASGLITPDKHDFITQKMNHPQFGEIVDLSALPMSHPLSGLLGEGQTS